MAMNGGAMKREAQEVPWEEPESKKSKNETKSVYRDISYPEQLQKKQEEVEKVFKDFGKGFVSRYPNLAQWFKGTFLETRFKIDNILSASGHTTAFRNKCEFTVGLNPELNKLCAGPRISDGNEQKVQVGPCDETLIHLTSSMIAIAQDFSNFLDKWNYLEESCPWLNFYIRQTKAEEHMLIAIVREDSQEKLKELKNELVKYYTDDYDLKHAIKSIFLQPRPDKCTKKAYELDFLHAHGEEFLIENVLDLKVVVTPGIFFPINTYAAEITYQKVLDLGDLNKRKTLVIDLWCGCGALSLLAARRSQFVIGIDPSKWNIKKAQFMAKYNKIRNIEFVISKPEDGLKKIWHQLEEVEEIVIIADPPTLCKMIELGDLLAEIPNLKRFIYIHSSHKLHFIKNMITLSQASLLPTRVIPVDVSPYHMRHEIITLMRRVDPYERPIVPPLDPRKTAWIEEIERRAFAMGMAKAMGGVSGSLPPRHALPLEDDYAYRNPAGFDDYGAEQDDFRAGGFGRGGYGAADDGEGFGAPARRENFRGRAVGFGVGREPVVPDLSETFGVRASGFGAARESFSARAGGRGAGFGARAGGRGAGFGAGAGGRGAGFGARAGGFGAPRGSLGTQREGFGARTSGFGAGREGFGSGGFNNSYEAEPEYGRRAEVPFGGGGFGGAGKGNFKTARAGLGHVNRGRGSFGSTSSGGFGKSGFGADAYPTAGFSKRGAGYARGRRGGW